MLRPVEAFNDFMTGAGGFGAASVQSALAVYLLALYRKVKKMAVMIIGLALLAGVVLFTLPVAAGSFTLPGVGG